MLKHILPLLLLLTLTGCWNDDKTATAPSDDANTTEVIDGHVLPPEPDPAVNNGTLLGVDVNDNGVRDDLERYIYHRFNGYEHAAKERAIAMQYGRAVQKILVDPEHAWENKTYEIMDRVIDCAFYYLKNFKPENLAYDIFDANYKDRAFNTRQRIEAYFRYQESLGGHIFTDGSSTIDKCDANISKL